MLLNRQVFAKDPLETTLPNDGVAKVVEPTTAEQWEVLRFELQSFVCSGEYERGLDRILTTYLTNLGKATQPAVWVSGFYGSGKSHLVRVLEMLWRDLKFSGGATARGLTTLSQVIEDNLKELTTASRPYGGLWSAAGTLSAGAGTSIRLALLGIIFRSAGLPERYPTARFTLWLQREGYDDAVRDRVQGAGKSWERELRSMYVSDVLARALLEANPKLATGEAAVRDLLRAEFPPVEDVSDDEMVAAIEEVLATRSAVEGRIPCTLIVLDELQQFLTEHPDQTLRAQEVVETCSSRFGSQLLFVATGQSALLAAPQLSKLQGRFTVTVQLSDKDVDEVVRRVVLLKAPDRAVQVEKVLEDASGEIERQLVGTKLGPQAEDRATLVPDYPLLPVRRRFWERVLRAVDRAGAAGQLRTQLRIVFEAVREVARRPLGTVVAGDRAYTQLAPSMLQTGVLLREVHEIISGQDDGTEAGRLRSRLCAAIFLISQLPTDPGAETGVRATAETLADLLVEDLTASSAGLRSQIPLLLQGLVEKGQLTPVGDEYRLQTRASAEWLGDFQSRRAGILGDAVRLATDRTSELKAAVGQALKAVSLVHGESKTSRKLELHFGEGEPKSETGQIPVWVRDAWSAPEKGVREAAQAAGTGSAVIYLYLPQRGADELKGALASYAAATETLDTRGTPSTREGEDARQGIVTRQTEARGTIDRLVAEVLRGARVYQGGGNEIAGADLAASVREAAEAARDRLYPQFADGDGAHWSTVIKRARDGSGDPLQPLGYQGDVEQHPACKAVLAFVGAGGRKGSEVRKQFVGPPYGWPQDAVDGALLALLATGHLRALQNGTEVFARQVDQTKINATEFRAVTVTATTKQRLAVRGLLADAKIDWKPNEEAAAVPQLLAVMLELAREAGGQPPLPSPPDVNYLQKLQGLGGNELIVAVSEQREQLATDRARWRTTKDRASARLPRWETLLRLLNHARGLPVYAEVEPQAEAIRESRTLLADPDPVPPLSGRLANEVRAAVTEARGNYERAFDQKMAEVSQTDEWNRLPDEEWKRILAAHDLGPLSPLRVENEGQLLATLDATPLPQWEDKTAALLARLEAARLDAAKRLEPKSVPIKLPSATLKTEADVERYLEEAREMLLVPVRAGSPVVL